MILITKPFFPPFDEYEELLKKIWTSGWITNNGPFVLKLEKSLKKYLDVPSLLFVGNGTIALQIAIKTLNLEKEIITTPFSYVATSSSIFWENCTPVFADIDKSTFNIDPKKIEEKITPNTTAILATHVFGNPCDVEVIQKIASENELKVIYDAAHCFGSKYKGESIFKWGDISTASFHATKIFHTVEGGALVSQNPDIIKKASYMRNFGHDGPGKFNGVGINGKNSELHAAMGILNLKYIDEILEKRKEQYFFYANSLKGLDLHFQKVKDQCETNFSYFPVLFDKESLLLKVLEQLKKKDIVPRRYFYPSLNKLGYLNGEAKISEDISSRILCLPLYHDLQIQDQEIIVRTIKNCL
jgi:dTDP-4-amino-4,6-dideoxygalactose transaminase